MPSIKRTAIRLGIINSEYISGKGVLEKVSNLKVKVCDSTYTEIFYCEWSTNYGLLAITQQKENILDGAKIKMTYNKTIINALRESKAIIYKDAIVDDAHSFALISSVEDIKEEHKEIEFQVKRMADK